MSDPLANPSVHMRAPTEPKPLGQVGNYQLLGVLGEGGMGIVYRARQTTINRQVAVKMIKPDVADTPATHHEAMVRFQRESQAVARLRHPNIVEVYEGGIHQGRPFLVMELLDGGSLEDRLRETGPMPAAAAVELFLPIVEAMSAAHAAGVVHRDLKPANILFDQAGRPKITDFGLARRMDVTNLSVTRSQEMIGSPCYMSPEQADGRPIGPASDVYSLGALLYEMLTGRPPLKGRSPQHTAMLLVYQQPEPLRQVVPGVSAALEAVCHKSLSKQADQRYAHAGELLAELLRLRAGQPVLAQEFPFSPSSASIPARPVLLPTMRVMAGAGVHLTAGWNSPTVPVGGNSSASTDVIAGSMSPTRPGLLPSGQSALRQSPPALSPPGSSQLPRLESLATATVVSRPEVSSTVTAEVVRPNRPRDRHAEHASSFAIGHWVRLLLITLLGGAIAGGLALGVRHSTQAPLTPVVDPDAELVAVGGADLAENLPPQEIAARFREALKRTDWTPEQRRVLGERLLLTEDRILLEDSSATLAETGEPEEMLTRFKDALARRSGWRDEQRRILAERVLLLEDRLLLGPVGEKLANDELPELALRRLTETLRRRENQWPSPQIKTLTSRIAHAEGRHWLSPLGDQQASMATSITASDEAASLVRTILIGNWSGPQRELLEQRLARVAERILPVIVPARTVHRAWIKGLAWSADGKHIVCGSDDGTLSVWDSVSLDLRSRPIEHPCLISHRNWVNQLAVSPDQQYLVSGSFGGAVQLWSLEFWPQTRVHYRYNSPVTGVTYADCGRVFVVLLENGKVHVYDAESGKNTWVDWSARLEVPSGNNDDHHSNNNTANPKHIRRAVASTDGQHLAVAYEDGRLLWMNTATGESVGPHRRHPGVNGMVFWKSQADSGPRLATVADDGSLRVWIAKDNLPVWKAKNDCSVHSVAVLPGDRLITADHRGRVRFWDSVSGNGKPSVEINISHTVAGLASSPDGRFLVVGGDTKAFNVISLPLPVPTEEKLMRAWLPVFSRNELDPNHRLVPIPNNLWEIKREKLLAQWRRVILLQK